MSTKEHGRLTQKSRGSFAVPVARPQSATVGRSVFDDDFRGLSATPSPPFTAPLRNSGEVDIGAASTSGEARNEVIRKAAGLAPIVGAAESAQIAMIKKDPEETVALLQTDQSRLRRSSKQLCARCQPSPPLGRYLDRTLLVATRQSAAPNVATESSPRSLCVKTTACTGDC